MAAKLTPEEIAALRVLVNVAKKFVGDDEYVRIAERALRKLEAKK